MKKSKKEGILIAHHISSFLRDYAPAQKTSSANTLKSYQSALTLYMVYLETEKGIRCEDLCGKCFGRNDVEEWLVWLKDSRGCSPETCNVRLASLRAFLKYLASREIVFLYLYQESSEIPRRKCLKKKVNGMSREAVKTLMECPDLSSCSGKKRPDFYGSFIQHSSSAK